MAIINFYEKYGFSITDDLEKIQWVIKQKITDEENDSFGEGHSERMLFLQSAKEVFATAKSKAKYDQDLTDSIKKRDPDAERKTAFMKWYRDAESYANEKQYDLAKTALNKAFQYATPETADYFFYCFATEIFALNANYSQAAEFANEAIVLAPDNHLGYFYKMETLKRCLLFEKNLSIDNMQDIWKQLMTTTKLMVDKAIANGHNYHAAQGYSLLADMHYKYVSGSSYYPLTANDNVLAEEYAVRALSLLESGENIDRAKKILDDITFRRTEYAELEKAVNDEIAVHRMEIAKLEIANTELERQKLLLFNTVSDQKSSINNVTTYGSTIFGKELELGIIAGALGIIILAFGGGGFGAILLIVSIAIFVIKGGIVSKNKNIQDTLISIQENESKIDQNTSQISKNTSQINNYRKIISQQSAELSQHPIKL